MARKNPVSERELAIGRRLREARERRLAKRTSLALKAGISTDQLASYEFGRVPLPWQAGDTLCRLLDANQFWLAKGVGEWFGYFESDPVLRSARGEFSKVHDELFLPGLKSGRKVVSHARELRSAADSIARIKKVIEAIDQDVDPVRFTSLIQDASKELAEVLEAVERIRGKDRSVDE